MIVHYNTKQNTRLSHNGWCKAPGHFIDFYGFLSCLLYLHCVFQETVRYWSVAVNMSLANVNDGTVSPAITYSPCSSMNYASVPPTAGSLAWKLRNPCKLWNVLKNDIRQSRKDTARSGSLRSVGSRSIAVVTVELKFRSSRSARTERVPPSPLHFTASWWVRERQRQRVKGTEHINLNLV